MSEETRLIEQDLRPIATELWGDALEAAARFKLASGDLRQQLIRVFPRGGEVSVSVPGSDESFPGIVEGYCEPPDGGLVVRVTPERAKRFSGLAVCQFDPYCVSLGFQFVRPVARGKRRVEGE